VKINNLYYKLQKQSFYIILITMRYLNELFNVNKREDRSLKFKLNANIKRKIFTFDTKGKRLDSSFLSYLFDLTNTFFSKYNLSWYILNINLHTMRFADKNVYMLLDLLVYYIIKEGKFLVIVSVEPEYSDGSVSTSIGFENTAIYQLSGMNVSLKNYENYKSYKNNFIEFYEKKLNASENWFRKFLTREILDNSITVSKVTTDVSSFLKNIGIAQETTFAINDTVSEIMSNTEHNDGDCLLDINVHGKYIYISFINLFNARLFDKLKIMHKNYTLTKGASEILNKAYKYHKEQFSEYYVEDDFYFISAFQSNITTKNSLSGGTGLTTAFNALSKQTLIRESYVLSGNNIIIFKSGLLGNNKKVIGFNKNNDYYTGIPDKELINRCELYIPGVVIQLGLELV